MTVEIKSLVFSQIIPISISRISISFILSTEKKLTLCCSRLFLVPKDLLHISQT